MPAPKGRILCTEDDADTRDLLVLTLSMAGYEAIPTDDPEQALKLIKTEKFDLCLLDNWLPGISGESLCKKIREFDSRTPILFYSGAASEAEKKLAMAAGAQGYLVKPVMGDQLVDEVRRIIAESKQVVPVPLVPPGQTDPTEPTQ
jgi:DNA-binding response OmpR family regulator